MRNHVTQIFISALTMAIFLASFNWLIDPYMIWNTFQIPGINTNKSQLANNERIFKNVGLAYQPADTIILGTSRSDIGLNPRHPALGLSAINLAFSGQSYGETQKLFDTLNDRSAIKAFVVGLDFYATTTPSPRSSLPAIDHGNKKLSDKNSWQLKFSISTLMDSLITIAQRDVTPSATWSEKGLRLVSPEHVKSMGGHRQYMNNIEKVYLVESYLPALSCPLDTSFPITIKSQPSSEIRAIFSRAHRENIALKPIISPSHSRQWEVFSAAGLWDQWEEWKHQLVNINEEEALRAGREPFPLWDFSGYNSISMETVPALGDTQTIMHWFFDSSHYTPAAGDLILDRVFNFNSLKHTVPEDFGVLLTSRNIDAHLASIRLAHEHYRETHSEDVTEIETMVREVAKIKHCEIKLPSS